MNIKQITFSPTGGTMCGGGCCSQPTNAHLPQWEEGAGAGWKESVEGDQIIQTD